MQFTWAYSCYYLGLQRKIILVSNIIWTAVQIFEHKEHNFFSYFTFFRIIRSTSQQLSIQQSYRLLHK